MGIEVQMDMRQIRDYLNQQAQKHIHQVINLLHYVGQTVVNQIRDSTISNWEDQTGNLRSSIGYIISLEGRPIEEFDYPQVDGPKRGTKDDPGFNPEVPKNYARQLASLYPKGIALIVVAGMEYASYVEKRENKTVLAQGEIEARRLVKQMLQELDAKMNASKE